MFRQSFDLRLQHLEDQLLELGSMVETAVLVSVDALSQRDLVTSQTIVEDDVLVNRKRFAIEEDALALIATQQPMAVDLRTIAAVLEIATELERIGDYAKGTARVSLMIGAQPLLKPLVDIPVMAQLTMAMLRQALSAFIRRDVETAEAIPEQDDAVDDLYNRVYRDLIAIITHDSRETDRATHLLWVAHNLERAGDRVTNICERIVFTVTGRMAELDVADDEMTSVLS